MAIDQHRRCALVRLELERRLLRNAPIVSSWPSLSPLRWSQKGVTLTVPATLAERVSRPVQSQPTLASRHLRTGYQNFHRGRCRRSLKSTWNPSKTHPESCAAIIITSRSSRSESLLEMILTEMAPADSSIRETAWFQSAVSGMPFSSAATAESSRATKQHSTLREVLSSLALQGQP
jgi:hypothetical protein